MTVSDDDRIQLTPAQVERLRKITPEMGDLLLASMNLMARQYLDVLMELRSQVDHLHMDNRLLREEVDHLRKELSDMRIAATMIQGLISGRK